MTAPYAPQSWVDGSGGGTPISAARLIVIENGVARYSSVQDEGTALTARPTMNFVGAGVTATDDGSSKTIVTIPGGAGVSSVTAGDSSIAVGGSAGAPTVAVNATGTASSTTFLRGDRTWATPAGGGSGIPASTFTAKGDLITGTGAGVYAVTSSGFNGQVLTTDGTATGGVNWKGTVGHTIQQGATALTQRNSLVFTGSGVAIVDDPSGVSSGGFPATEVMVNANYFVRAATTSLNGTSTFGVQVVDGVSCVAGDKVFYKDSSTPTFNGIYVVQTSNWTRAPEMDVGITVPNATLLYVHEGAINGGKTFQLNNPSSGSTSTLINSVGLIFNVYKASQWLTLPLNSTDPSVDSINVPPGNGNYTIVPGATRPVYVGVMDGVPGQFHEVKLCILTNGTAVITIEPASTVWSGIAVDQFGRPILNNLAGGITYLTMTWMDTNQGFIGVA